MRDSAAEQRLPPPFAMSRRQRVGVLLKKLNPQRLRCGTVLVGTWSGFECNRRSSDHSLEGPERNHRRQKPRQSSAAKKCSGKYRQVRAEGRQRCLRKAVALPRGIVCICTRVFMYSGTGGSEWFRTVPVTNSCTDRAVSSFHSLAAKKTNFFR